MPGFTSNRGKTRNRGVPEPLRKRVLRRDGQICQLQFPGCSVEATQVDHVIPWHASRDHSLSNLQAVCIDCHKVKTQQEAQAARRKIARKRRPARHVMDGIKSDSDWDKVAAMLNRGRRESSEVTGVGSPRPPGSRPRTA